MKFDTPASTNPIDQMKIIGQPKDRVEGKLKTTGTATYAYEQQAMVSPPAYGYVVGSSIGKGRISSIDSSEARQASGVIAIVTYENAGHLDRGEFYVDRALAGPQVDHYHQAVAIVVAHTFEQARAASALVRVYYVRESGSYDLAAQRESATTPAPGAFGPPPQTAIGDFEGAFKKAAFTLDGHYTTPDHAHAMMEPHATIAQWQGEKLTLWTSIQQMNWGVRDLAKTLGIPKDDIHLISPYIGGGFGGKGTILCDAVLASLAAREAGRPVKVALPRPLMFNNLTHRPATIQRIRLGANPDGTLTAIGHESWSGNLRGGRTEAATASTRTLYAGANRMTRLYLAKLDLAEGSAMRAPGEAPGMMALEIAMDEMAEKLGMDPVRFRVINDTQVDPEQPDRPFSKRQLVECLNTGANHFGWARRNARPGKELHDGWWVGMGMASAIRGAPTTKSAARVRLDRKGLITVETDMTDIGTGSYTIIAQTAAEMLGVEMYKVNVYLGDSRFPESSGSGGQWGAASSTAGVYAACVKLREVIATKLGLDPTKAEFIGGHVREGSNNLPLDDATKDGDLSAEDVMEFGDLAKQYAQQAFGAHFVEVGVNAATGEIRIRRQLAVCAAGRILNPKTARSQIIGGMTMGAGAALMEEMIVDHRLGFFVNHDLASYEVPVHADIPHQEVIFLDEVDPYTTPLKAKGVGELGISGAAAAIANAVYNATGIRVRDYPITLDKLIEHLPALG
ncbi:xanthine dehydrogenase family protein molybdopterin-binding subunit [Pseudomonas sp. CDFA 602]|uniref:aldehyde oxidoreductase molybdenum-binding subunit PaoC n=1 Tax=Pseudomonas californiensis TaxID=2829823 RepID=UPI001E3F4EF7|nr:aldehyde oxidoreductase molybdenum-binding subunit PaoC [Pseudomonas californiensis]MCD5996331.1 xanthine dehydrogenase family protein molybdopterin-binding subunit [Pseudomonas californiensis]MCD6001930.1 xanthine dehydrogenase family protein molybdopterin-binding subunit [Pseudomonas californiensis]